MIAPIILTVLFAVLCIAVLCGLMQWAKLYANDLSAASAQLDDFYSAAQQLAKDPNTPESVLSFISFFSSRVGTPFLARSFAWHLITGGLSKRDTSPVAKQFAEDLARLDKSQNEAFSTMIAAGMISSAASDPILSRPYLIAVRTFLSSNGREGGSPSVERANTLAADFTAKTRELRLAFC